MGLPCCCQALTPVACSGVATRHFAVMQQDGWGVPGTCTIYRRRDIHWHEQNDDMEGDHGSEWSTPGNQLTVDPGSVSIPACSAGSPVITSLVETSTTASYIIECRSGATVLDRIAVSETYSLPYDRNDLEALLDALVAYAALPANWPGPGPYVTYTSAGAVVQQVNQPTFPQTWRSVCGYNFNCSSGPFVGFQPHRFRHVKIGSSGSGNSSWRAEWLEGVAVLTRHTMPTKNYRLQPYTLSGPHALCSSILDSACVAMTCSAGTPGATMDDGFDSMGNPVTLIFAPTASGDYLDLIQCLV